MAFDYLYLFILLVLMVFLPIIGDNMRVFSVARGAVAFKKRTVKPGKTTSNSLKP